jgi:hypothetical protein
MIAKKVLKELLNIYMFKMLPKKDYIF